MVFNVEDVTVILNNIEDFALVVTNAGDAIACSESVGDGYSVTERLFEALGEDKFLSYLRECRSFEGPIHDKSVIWSVSEIRGARKTEHHRLLVGRLPLTNSNYRDLVHQMHTDELTDVGNRRYLKTRLPDEFARCSMRHTEAAFLLLDLDGFKEINDIHGHQVGDQVLTVFASRLKAAIRPTDILARLGGDEFVLFLPTLDQEAVAARVEALRESIAGDISVSPGSFSVGVSCGVSLYPHDGVIFEDLYSIADKRMYEDKAERKSRR